MSQAIMKSLQETRENINSNSYEPLNPEQRKREEGQPCGLKNIGNTCYFNSLLQVYYNLPRFVQEVLEFVDDGQRLASLSGPAPNAGSGGAPAAGSNNPQDVPVQDTEEK